MNEEEVLKTLMNIEAGTHAYVEGDFMRIRQMCESFGCFLVAPIGNNTCKVTKVKVKQESFYAMVCNQLEDYHGTPVEITGDVSTTRMVVSKFNKKNECTFRVRAIGDNLAEIYSETFDDYAWIPADVFNAHREKVMDELNALREKVRYPEPIKIDPAPVKEITVEVGFSEGEHADEEADDDIRPGHFDYATSQTNETPHVSSEPVEGTAICTECGDEFFKQGSSNLCADCFNEDLV